MLFANPEIPVDQVIQYGSFGLVVAMILYDWIYARPSAAKNHREERKEVTDNFTRTITMLVDEAKRESEECRKERIETTKANSIEREEIRKAVVLLTDKIG